MGRKIKKLFTAWKCCQGLGVLDSGEDSRWGRKSQATFRKILGPHSWPPAQCTCSAPPFSSSVKKQSNNGFCLRERMGEVGMRNWGEKAQTLQAFCGRSSRRRNSEGEERRGCLLPERGKAPGSGGGGEGRGRMEAGQLLKHQLPRSPVCQMAHLSKKATQGRITRRTKPSSGVSTLWHSGAMGKAAHADLSTKVWML